MIPNQAVILALLTYDPDTGLLCWRERAREFLKSDHEWKRWNTRYAGSPAFTSKDGHGYFQGSIFGRLHLAHRVIWKMQTGQDAPADIDHDDRDRANNRWANLNPATRRQNCMNQGPRITNTSGVTGVHWDAASRKWRAQIRKGAKNCALGSFNTLEAATFCRRAAERELGYHPNHGRHS